MITRVVRAAGIASLAALLSASIVFAHARYTSSSPAAESTIATLGPVLSVTFSEELRAVTLSVVGPDGSTVSTDKATFDLAERSVATVPVRSAGPGRYTVNWTSVSDDDGDSATGTFGFTVATTAVTVPATIAPTCSPTDKPDPGFDQRANTYCKRQSLRDQYRGKINEPTFNEALAAGTKLEDALQEAMDDLAGKAG